MDYQNHYNLLINRARNRLLEGYTEKHHVIPKCVGTDNEIVILTPEEHYVAHQLLIKIYPNESKLVYAAKMMTVGSSNHSRNNKLYGWLRKRHSSILTGVPKSKESNQKRSRSLKGRTWEELYGLERATQLKNNLKGNTRGKGNKNKPKSEDHKRKLSDSLKGNQNARIQ